MIARVALPFRVLPEKTVAAEPWLFSLDGGQAEPVTGHLPDWDNASTLVATRRIAVDFETAADALAIAPEQLRLGFALQVGTGPGRLPRLLRTAQTREIRVGEAEIRIEQTIPGHSLAAQLELRCLLHLAAAPAESGALAPTRAGARLWSDAHNLRLEGDAPRFPLEEISFADRFPGQAAARALWHVQWTPGDPGRDFHGAVRLQLNTDREEFIARVKAGDALTLQTMMGDVISTLCEGCLQQEDYEEALADCDPTTVGGRVRAWLALGWPATPLSGVRAVLDQRPGQFRATLSAVAEFGEGDEA